MLKISGGGDLGRFYGMTERHMSAMAALGFRLFQESRTDEAGTIFGGMIALDDRSGYGFAGLGAIALAKEPADLEAACANLRRAAELRPDDPAVAANLAEALLRMGQFDEAAREFARCLRLDPKRGRARAIVSSLPSIVAALRKIEAGR